jgi:hypothetical protein
LLAPSIIAANDPKAAKTDAKGIPAVDVYQTIQA